MWSGPLLCGVGLSYVVLLTTYSTVIIIIYEERIKMLKEDSPRYRKFQFSPIYF